MRANLLNICGVTAWLPERRSMARARGVGLGLVADSPEAANPVIGRWIVGVGYACLDGIAEALEPEF